MMRSSALTENLKISPLDSLHRRLGGRMVGFAGWSLPVQFQGTLAEHQAARTAAALFDVSHMGQMVLRGTAVARALETLVPGDIAGLAPFRQRYTLLLNEAGGILDDLMVANFGDHLFLVVNAARAAADLAHMRARLPGISIAHLEDRALLALQGPLAGAVLGRHAPGVESLPFLGVAALDVGGVGCLVSRSGYTGEDGYEISVPAAKAEALAVRLLAAPEVSPAGLAARDTLRLEAGLCLYGNDIDELTSPIEAALGWSIGKRRRQALDFPGADVVADHLAHGPTRLRVGIRPEGRALARARTEIVAGDGTLAGIITSGGFAPSLGAPVAMGYVRRDLATLGTPLSLLIRGQRHPATVSPLPFVPHRFAK
jgi:aminomethyltransferase